jgi:RNA polymerase sigma-70 factor (ECF subfamily)
MLTPAEIDAVLEQVGRGHRDSFRFIVRAFSLPLRCYIASQLHHPDDVDDLTQEVFIAAYRDLPSYGKGRDFGAWLRGIARNKLLDHFRSSSRRDKALERFRREVAQAVEADLERAAAASTPESVEALLRCISRLPDKLRRVVRGGLDGDKPEALAAELVTSVGAIYNLHYRANQSLRECVKKELS